MRQFRVMESQVAVTTGASRVRRLDVTLGHVSAMRFPPELTLDAHSHPAPTVAVVVEGGFTGTYRRGERDCQSRAVIVEPAGEVHANRFGPNETSILTLSLADGVLAPAVEATARQFRHDRDPYAELIARRAVTELDRPDDVTPLAIEAAALELIARVTRTAQPERRPAWLSEALAVLHDRYSESLTLADVAAAIDVEPERLARGFRRAFGEPMAEYLRRIRVDVAASQLASTDLPISQVAGDVGFADQSHLTRWCTRYLGTTPGRYRAARRDRPRTD